MKNKEERRLLLSPDSDVSMMRWAVYQMTPIVRWLLIAAPIILILEALIPVHKIDWGGVGIYIGSVATFYTGLLMSKAVQKFGEMKRK